MARRFGGEKVSHTTAIVSDVCPTRTDIVVAQDGFIISLAQVIAVNQTSEVKGITLYDGGTQITPSIPIGGSGTLIWDNPGGGQLELTRGSGLEACLDTTGSMEVTVYYVYHDDQDPITKEEARTATYIPSNATATRTPNDSGGQSKT